jgi:MFS family permease
MRDYHGTLFYDGRSDPTVDNRGLTPRAGVAEFLAEASSLVAAWPWLCDREFYTADSVNLVLTDIIGSFGVSGDKASWSPTVYSSAVFRGVPICFWLAGHIGHKSYLIAFILPFVGASVVSATCYSFQTMLVARAFQGLVGAGLVVWSRGSVYMLLPKPRRSESLMRVSTMLYLCSAFGIVTDQSIGRAGRLNAAFPRTRRD